MAGIKPGGPCLCERGKCNFCATLTRNNLRVRAIEQKWISDSESAQKLPLSTKFHVKSPHWDVPLWVGRVGRSFESCSQNHRIYLNVTMEPITITLATWHLTGQIPNFVKWLAASITINLVNFQWPVASGQWQVASVQ